MRDVWKLSVGALLLAVANLAVAGGFSLSPLGLTISSRDSSSAVVAENTSNAPLVIQVKALAWTQRDGKDVREETRDVIVNPPIFKVGPGEQQLVRVASRLGPPRNDETAYRIVFTEVPQKDAPKVESGFRIALAMDIPLYFEPVAAASPASIRWDAERTPTGLRLRADNPGNVHYRIVDAQFVADGKTLHKQGVIVVLPKSQLVLDLPAPSRDTTVIHLTADDGASHQVSIDLPIPASR